MQKLLDFQHKIFKGGIFSCKIWNIILVSSWDKTKNNAKITHFRHKIFRGGIFSCKIWNITHWNCWILCKIFNITSSDIFFSITNQYEWNTQLYVVSSCDKTKINAKIIRFSTRNLQRGCTGGLRSSYMHKFGITGFLLTRSIFSGG